ncbi:hypothetical protein AB0878_46255 [Amycolatopsis sp. NPDC047767]|uniref:hypothetical protein n=1 Tax=Amycolatopsis sp. NPDC047767 TaxID=3156765 RepID=UPI003455F7C1
MKRLCRKAVIDRARHALVDFPMLQPPHQDRGASLREFRAKHRVLVTASGMLAREDPAAQLVTEALDRIAVWRSAWVSVPAEQQFTAYIQLRAELLDVERILAQLMGWHPLSSPVLR